MSDSTGSRDRNRAGTKASTAIPTAHQKVCPKAVGDLRRRCVDAVRSALTPRRL